MAAQINVRIFFPICVRQMSFVFSTSLVGVPLHLIDAWKSKLSVYVCLQQQCLPVFHALKRSHTYAVAPRSVPPAFSSDALSSEHVASVKDLKTRVITPAKDAGTPQKGLLKVGGGGGSGVKPMKPVATRKDTPHVSKKKASDFF